jgi:hypothetical protein
VSWSTNTQSAGMLERGGGRRRERAAERDLGLDLRGVCREEVVEVVGTGGGG